jgi:hypothetical protein
LAAASRLVAWFGLLVGQINEITAKRIIFLSRMHYLFLRWRLPSLDDEREVIP